MDEKQKQQYGALGTLFSLQGPEGFGDEYVSPRLEATSRVAQTIQNEVVQEGLLSPVEGARTIAASIAAIWGLDELIANASPGPGFQVSEMFQHGRSPVSASN